MPDFILNDTAPDATFSSDFVRGYVEAMFFTNGDTGSEDEDLLNELGTGALSAQSVINIETRCKAFLDNTMPNGETVAAWVAHYGEDYKEVQAGRDLWFTQQGHGCGYWDRDELSPETRDCLTGFAALAGEANVDASPETHLIVHY